MRARLATILTTLGAVALLLSTEAVRRPRLIWNATQYASIAHFGVSSQTWNQTHGLKSLHRLSFPSVPIHRTRHTDTTC